MIKHPSTHLRTLTALVLAAGLLTIAGCSSKGGGETKTASVDCKKFCNKTFGTCVDEVILDSGKMDKKKMKAFKKLGFYKKVQQEGLNDCLKACDKRKGRFKDAKGVNDCLRIQDCKKFAPCITPHIKARPK